MGGFGVRVLAVKIGVISLRDTLSGSRMHIMRLSLGIRLDRVCLRVSVLWHHGMHEGRLPVSLSYVCPRAFSH